MPMEPERLDDMERVAAAMAATNEGAWTDQTVLDLIAEIRRLTAERYAAVAQAQASGEEARVLREAADALMHAADEVLREHGQEAHIWRLSVHAAKLDAALAAPPTTYAKLAAARAEYIAADRMPGGLPDSQEWRSKFDRLRAAKDALAEAEREAGVGRS